MTNFPLNRGRCQNGLKCYDFHMALLIVTRIKICSLCISISPDCRPRFSERDFLSDCAI